MEEIIDIIGNFGVSVAIVILFLYDWFTTRKDMQKTLEQHSKCLDEIKNTNINNAETNRNTAKSLELLQKSMDNQSDFLQTHDKRCENIEKNIEKIEIRLEDR